MEEYNINELDSLVGIAASGTTPYVIGAMKEANKSGIITGGIISGQRPTSFRRHSTNAPPSTLDTKCRPSLSRMRSFRLRAKTTHEARMGRSKRNECELTDAQKQDGSSRLINRGKIAESTCNLEACHRLKKGSSVKSVGLGSLFRSQHLLAADLQ